MTKPRLLAYTFCKITSTTKFTALTSLSKLCAIYSFSYPPKVSLFSLSLTDRKTPCLYRLFQLPGICMYVCTCNIYKREVEASRANFPFYDLSLNFSSIMYANSKRSISPGCNMALLRKVLIYHGNTQLIKYKVYVYCIMYDIYVVHTQELTSFSINRERWKLGIV